MTHMETAKRYVEALGGLNNIKTIDNCITRLRLEIVDMEKIQEDEIIKIGCMGTIYVGGNKFHLIIGAQVVGIASEMHKLKGDHVLAKGSASAVDGYAKIAEQYMNALGGSSNLNKIDNCITRLRLTVKDMKKIDDNTLHNMGNKGVLHKSDHHLHIVIGLTVTSIADEMRRLQLS